MKFNVKKIYIFYLILIGILSILILSVKNWGGGGGGGGGRGGGEEGGGLLNGQILLSMTKVICRQSLTIKKFILQLDKNFSNS